MPEELSIPNSKPQTPNQFKIVHDRPGCIGCGACVAVTPDYWEMKEDGKSSIKHPDMKHVGETEELETSKDFDKHKEAAEVCPVNVIHIEKDGKRLI